MNRSRLQLWPLLKATFRKWNADNCLRLGASLSYYTLFSLFPLILVSLSIVRLLLTNSDAARDAILAGLSSVTGGFRDDFVAALDAASKARATSGIIGTITLILGASWVFGELVSAFNIIWEVKAPSEGGPWEFLRTTFTSFALVLAAVFLLLISMIVNAALTFLTTFTTALPGGSIVRELARQSITVAVLTLIFALLFRFLPRTPVAWRDVWLGAAFTAIAWTLLQSAIAFYIALSSYKNYGAIGSILALVAWVYLSSQVVFFGGEFTAVYAREHGSRKPDDGVVTPAA